MTLNIVFKNTEFVIIDKPGGMLSVPSRLGAKDPRPVAGICLQTELGQQVFPVHRLDEDVSGLLMFALTTAAHRIANKWFEQHQIVKTYEALATVAENVDLTPWTPPVLWECKLMRGKKRAYEAEFGKPAVTRAMLVSITPEHKTTWHLQPLTGRSHQLRYEMMRHGFPIDGDSLYGSKVLFTEKNSIGLRAVQLDFRVCNNRTQYSLPEIISLPTTVPINLSLLSSP